MILPSDSNPFVMIGTCRNRGRTKCHRQGSSREYSGHGAQTYLREKLSPPPGWCHAFSEHSDNRAEQQQLANLLRWITYVGHRNGSRSRIREWGRFVVYTS